ncbi:MAG TPA: proline racemase family protein [Candidatus Limnocylindria bacterium]|nr:proline racemase family protein [Candidatus Limnocylindria bacterium]
MQLDAMSNDPVRNLALAVDAVDYHTAGEPFRIVTGGVPPLKGKTILEKRRYAAEHLDHIRKLLVCEPRGHADMYGCFVTEPEDDGADVGVVFFHNAGYSTACGHGTVALVTWALESGFIRPTGAETTVVVDAPSGRLTCVASVTPAGVSGVRFRNVPSYVLARGTLLRVRGRDVPVDIAYGGAFYASVDAALFGMPVEKQGLDDFIALGREIKQAIEGSRTIVHPEHPDISGIYGVIFYETLEDRPGEPLVQRNVTIFADGEVDRSPCGSGTTSRLALLHDAGALPDGRVFVNEGLPGERFRGRVIGTTTGGAGVAVLTEVAGAASLTGYHSFVLKATDPLGTGFLFR